MPDRIARAQTASMDTELTYDECLALLRATSVGRCAFCTPQGAVIVPVNYRVIDDAVVFRTTPHSHLGVHGWSSWLAFEVDGIDPARQAGWSVIATGRGAFIEDPDELAFIRSFHDPTPWASGSREVYLRLRWRQLTGRRVRGSSAFAGRTA